MSTTVRVNDTVQFTFFLVMRLNITTATSCDSFIVILVCLSKTSLELKYGFVELVVILFTFNTRCDYVILSDFAYTIWCDVIILE